MEIQQLQVKISAEMSGVQRALISMKNGFLAVKKSTATTESSMLNMDKQASSGFRRINAQLTAMADNINKAGQAIKDAFDSSKWHIQTDKTTGLQAVNLDKLKQDLAEAQDLLKGWYHSADQIKQQITIETDPSKLLQLYSNLDNCNLEITGLQDKIYGLQTALRGFEAQEKEAFTVPEIQTMQQKVQELYTKLSEAKSELALQRHIDFGSDEAEAAAQKVADLTHQYNQLYAQLALMVNKAQEEGQAQQKAAEIGQTGWEKAANALGKLGGYIATIGSGMMKVMVPAAKGVKNAFLGISKAMWKLNLMPKLFGKISNSLHSIWRRIKTAFIFSVINSWFHKFRDRVSNYLKTNQELQSALSSLKGTFLTAFQPIYERMIPAIITLINWLSTAINTIAKFISLLTGKSIASMSANAQALYEQANGYEAAGGAAEEAAKTIAAFDELNVLNGPKSGGGGGSGDNEIGATFPDLEEADEFGSWGEVFSNILDKLIAKLPTFNELLQNIAEKINAFTGNVLEMFNFPGVDEKIAQLGTGLAASFNNMWDTIDWTQLGGSVGAAVDGIFNFVLSYIRERDWKGIGSNIAEFINGSIREINWENVGELLISGWNIVWQTFNGFVSTLDWTELGNSISTAFQSALEHLDFESFVSSVSNVAVGITKMLATFVSQTDWKQVGKALVDGMCKFIETMDWGELMKALATLSGAILAASFQLGAGILEAAYKGLIDAIDAIGAFFKDEIERAGGNIAKGILNGIIDIFINIYDWIYNNIFKPFIDGIKSVFGIHSPSTVMEEYGVYIVEGLWNGIKETWDRLVAWITGVFDDFKRLCENTWDSIRSTAANTWNNIKNEITTKISDIKSKVSTVWTELKGNTISAFNSLKTVASSIWSKISVNLTSWADSIGSKVSEAFTGLKTTVVNVFNAMKEAIKVPINAIIGFINGLISGVVSGLNNMIYAMNRLHFDVPDWVPWMGGKSFGFNIGYLTAPQIPLLAKGGVITEPTMAMIGEYAGANSNPEIVAPQDMLRETMIAANGEMVAALYQIATQIIQVIDEKDLEVSIGDDIIAQSAKRGADNYRRRTGRLLFA